MQEPHDLIKDFIDEKLQGNLHRLVNFDLTQLRGDRKYGSCNGGRFDCDNTALARAIYALVFDDVYLTCPEKNDNSTLQQLMALCQSDFKPYFTQDGFKSLTNKLLLNSYIDNEGNPLKLFETIYHWDPKLTREAYISHATSYLDFSESFIEERGRRIVEILEERI